MRAITGTFSGDDDSNEVVTGAGLGKVRPGVNLSDRNEGWIHNYRGPDVVAFLKTIQQFQGAYFGVVGQFCEVSTSQTDWFPSTTPVERQNRPTGERTKERGSIGCRISLSSLSPISSSP